MAKKVGTWYWWGLQDTLLLVPPFVLLFAPWFSIREHPLVGTFSMYETSIFASLLFSLSAGSFLLFWWSSSRRFAVTGWVAFAIAAAWLVAVYQWEQSNLRNVAEHGDWLGSSVAKASFEHQKIGRGFLIVPAIGAMTFVGMMIRRRVVADVDAELNALPGPPPLPTVKDPLWPGA